MIIVGINKLLINTIDWLQSDKRLFFNQMIKCILLKDIMKGILA